MLKLTDEEQIAAVKIWAADADDKRTNIVQVACDAASKKTHDAFVALIQQKRNRTNISPCTACLDGLLKELERVEKAEAEIKRLEGQLFDFKARFNSRVESEQLLRNALKLLYGQRKTAKLKRKSKANQD